MLVINCTCRSTCTLVPEKVYSGLQLHGLTWSTYTSLSKGCMLGYCLWYCCRHLYVKLTQSTCVIWEHTQNLFLRHFLKLNLEVHDVETCIQRRPGLTKYNLCS